MKLVRLVLGQLILFFDFVFTPRSKKRTADEQAWADKQMAGISLYEFKACPFCVKVRRGLKRQGVVIPRKDAKSDEQARSELATGGGKVKVPCLRIEEAGEVRWLYESNDILDFIDQRLDMSSELSPAK